MFIVGITSVITHQHILYRMHYCHGAATCHVYCTPYYRPAGSPGCPPSGRSAGPTDRAAAALYDLRARPIMAPVDVDVCLLSKVHRIMCDCGRWHTWQVSDGRTIRSDGERRADIKRQGLCLAAVRFCATKTTTTYYYEAPGFSVSGSFCSLLKSFHNRRTP